MEHSKQEALPNGNRGRDDSDRQIRVRDRFKACGSIEPRAIGAPQPPKWDAQRGGVKHGKPAPGEGASDSAAGRSVMERIRPQASPAHKFQLEFFQWGPRKVTFGPVSHYRGDAAQKKAAHVTKCHPSFNYGWSLGRNKTCCRLKYSSTAGQEGQRGGREGAEAFLRTRYLTNGSVKSKTNQHNRCLRSQSYLKCGWLFQGCRYGVG